MTGRDITLKTSQVKGFSACKRKASILRFLKIYFFTYSMYLINQVGRLDNLEFWILKYILRNIYRKRAIITRSRL